jgi:hypothetical protein
VAARWVGTRIVTDTSSGAGDGSCFAARWVGTRIVTDSSSGGGAAARSFDDATGGAGARSAGDVDARGGDAGAGGRSGVGIALVVPRRLPGTAGMDGGMLGMLGGTLGMLGIRGNGPLIDSTGVGTRDVDAPGMTGIERVACDGACGDPGAGEPGGGEPGDGEPGDGDPGGALTLGIATEVRGIACVELGLIDGSGVLGGAGLDTAVAGCSVRVTAGAGGLGLGGGSSAQSSASSSTGRGSAAGLDARDGASGALEAIGAGSGACLTDSSDGGASSLVTDLKNASRSKSASDSSIRWPPR